MSDSGAGRPGIEEKFGSRAWKLEEVSSDSEPVTGDNYAYRIESGRLGNFINVRLLYRYDIDSSVRGS